MAVTQYIGSRYVPLFADPAEWSSAKAYEPLTVVLHEGSSYTSKQSVPVGIDIDNTDFWAQTGNYNAQMEQYRREVGGVVSDMADLREEVTQDISDIAASVADKMEYGRFKTVRDFAESANPLSELLNHCANNDFVALIDDIVTVSSSITVSGTNLYIVGRGSGKLEFTTSGNAITFAGLNSVSVSDLTIVDTKLSAESSRDNRLFYFVNCSNINISRCVAGPCNSASCFYITGNSRPIVHIDGCSFNDFASTDGIGLYNSNGILIATNCSFSNFYPVANSSYYCYPVCVTYDNYTERKSIADGIIVDNCTFENCDWEGPDTHGSRMFVVTNCTMHNCGRFFHAYMDARVDSNKYRCNMIVRNNLMYNSSSYNFNNICRAQLSHPFGMYGAMGRIINSVDFSNNIITIPQDAIIDRPIFQYIETLTMQGNTFNYNRSRTAILYMTSIQHGCLENNSFVNVHESYAPLDARCCNLTVRHCFFDVVRGYMFNRFFCNRIDSDFVLYNEMVANTRLYNMRDTVYNNYTRIGQPNFGYGLAYYTEIAESPKLGALRFSADGSKRISATCPSEQPAYYAELVEGMRCVVNGVTTRIIKIDYDYGHKLTISGSPDDVPPVMYLTLYNEIPAADNLIVEPTSFTIS